MTRDSMTSIQLQRLISFTISTKNALSKTQIIKYSFILLRVFVGRCAECKNVHSVSYIKKTPFLIHIYLYLDGKKLLAYSMEQSPSWDTNRFSTSQEITRILGNPKVHCRIHKCPPPIKESVQVWDLCGWFVRWYFLLQVGGPPLVNCTRLLIPYIRH